MGDVHAVDRGDCGDRQRDHRDHGEPLGGHGRLGLGPSPVELDDAVVSSSMNASSRCVRAEMIAYDNS
jgi:hypothetical protein